MRALLIEDNPDDVMLLQELLAGAEGDSIELDCVSSVADGIARLAQRDVDIVLLDLSLPDSLGLQTLDCVLGAVEDVPVVVLSGAKDADMASRALQRGAQDYLVKGHFDIFLLQRAMRYALERQQAQEEQKRLRAQLLQSQKLESLGTLAGGVAHEINNPINGVMNYAQLIKDETPVGTSAHQFATEIIAETERVAAIVRNLLMFARQDKQSHSPARIVDIVTGTLSLVRTILRHDQITLEVDVSENLPKVACRSQQIQQVFMNLLINARDALNERFNGYAVDKLIRVSAYRVDDETGSWVRTTVEDHGAGIASDVRERMFEPFFTTKGEQVGTGLGLAITHGIVKDHDGRLTVESELGEFTRFHVDLPLAESSQPMGCERRQLVNVA